MSSATYGGRLTDEEFARLPEDDRYLFELVRGQVVREPRPGPLHGRITVKLARRLDEFAEQHGLGLVFTETGFTLYRDPDTVRGPDLSFVSHERVPSSSTSTFWRFAPDLAVEVLSPSNRPREILAKVGEYLAAGSRLVWVVDPQRRVVTIHVPGEDPRRISGQATLEGGTVLPGFALQLDELFVDL